MSASPHTLLQTAVPVATSREVEVEREQGGHIEHAIDLVAEERPVGLLYHGIPHVVMLASPADLEDLAVGFTISEALVPDRTHIRSVELAHRDGSLNVDLQISSESFSALLRRRRNLTGRTGCGLCGVETVEDAVRDPQSVGAGIAITCSELHEQLESLNGRQPINAKTGSVHAAAWALPGKGIQVVREDVGRHNALDKVIGALARAQVDARDGYFLITSRASFEMVQKTAMVGVSLLAAVSAPTALAIDVATKTGVTLVGFARTDRHVIYSHAHRLKN